MQTSTPSLLLIVLALALPGCEKPSSPPPAAPHSHAPGDDHSHDDGHEHAAPAKPAADGHAHADGHGHGPEAKLGEQTVDGLTIAAVREGEAKPGTEASFDCTITSQTVKIVAVRMWVGTQDAKGSMKAKAAMEDGHWHAHVEIPATLTAESKFWVEVETDKGTRSLAGFGL